MTRHKPHYLRRSSLDHSDSALDRALTRSAAQEILNSPTCLLWPKCGCHETIVHWQKVLKDADGILTMEALEAAEVVIFFACACAAEHCPDPETKAYAKRQFENLTQRRYRIAREQHEIALQELRAQRAREAGAN
jgi:hypothetical protein